MRRARAAVRHRAGVRASGSPRHGRVAVGPGRGAHRRRLRRRVAGQPARGGRLAAVQRAAGRVGLHDDMGGPLAPRHRPHMATSLP
eukprot:13569684-Heterocapsa_arctica.AAC.1